MIFPVQHHVPGSHRVAFRRAVKRPFLLYCEIRELHLVQVVEILPADNLLAALISHSSIYVEGIFLRIVAHGAEVSRPDSVSCRFGTGGPLSPFQIESGETAVVAPVSEASENVEFAVEGVEPFAMVVHLHVQILFRDGIPYQMCSVKPRHRYGTFPVFVVPHFIGVDIACFRIHEIGAQCQCDRAVIPEAHASAPSCLQIVCGQGVAAECPDFVRDSVVSGAEELIGSRFEDHLPFPAVLGYPYRIIHPAFDSSAVIPCELPAFFIEAEPVGRGQVADDQILDGK